MPPKARYTVKEAAAAADRSRTAIHDRIEDGTLVVVFDENGKRFITGNSLRSYIRKIKSGKIKRGNFSLVKKD